MLVQAGIRRIATMQLPGGGFSLWQGEQQVHLWGSVYATHFLVEARRAGHPVEDGLYRNALAWLAGEVKAKGTYGSEELQRTVYGLYVLSRAGKADLGTMDFVRQKHAKELSTESRAMLAASYAAAGNPRATQSLAANLGAVQEIQRQTGGNFDSAIRNRALLLLALLDADPRSPQIPPWSTGWRATRRPTSGGPPRRRASRCWRSASSSRSRPSSRPTAGRSSWAARRSGRSTTGR